MKAQTVKESQRTRVEPVSVLPDISYSYDFLNSAQRKAVMHRGGPLLIIAGAGTGKTSVITNRILWLIQQGLARPEQILALTFTNKAAQEMEERVDVIMPYGYTEMWISTFHAFCDQVLKQDAIHIGLDPGFILMALAQEYVFFRSHLFEMSLDRFRPHGNPTKFIGEILRHFSRLGDEDIAPDEYLEYVKKNTDLSDEQRADFLELATVYGQYSRMKEQESRFGFYDLVPQVLRLFRRRPLVLKRWQEKFKYVLVDEFQDTNYAQNELVEMLVGEGGRITVVGDDDQSIYKFRGAAISNILDFKKTYPKYSSVVLTQNYRSHTGILDTAYRLIKNNDPYRLEVTEKVDKRLVSVRDGDIPPSTYKKKAGTSSQQEELPLSSMETGVSNGQPSTSEDRTPGIPADKTVRRIHERTDVAEAEAVAKEIERLVSKEGYCYRDIALLVRAHDHSEEFMQSFRYHGIPFSLLGPKGLYSRPEIKNLIAFLRILTDYCDDASLYRVLMIKKILTPREFIDLQHLARKRRISMFELCEELVGVKVGVRPRKNRRVGMPSTSEALVPESLLSEAALMWVHELLEMFDHAFRQVADNRPVGTIMYDFIEKADYIDTLLDQDERGSKGGGHGEWQVQNVSSYFDTLARFERDNEDHRVVHYMQYLDYALEIGENPQLNMDQVAEFDGVSISTIHSAKGREFPVVFLVNLVSDRFPSRNRHEVLPIPGGLIKEHLPEGDPHLQEERRLCYVGMTRAKDILYLTSADYYSQGIRKKKQSVFLYETGLVVEPEPVVGRETTDTRSGKKDLARAVFRSDDVEISPEIGASFLSGLKRQLSFSHLSSYSNCPYQFYFKYVLKIPGAASASRSFGMTMHNTLRQFYEMLMRSKQGFEGFETAPELTDLLAIYDRKWQADGYENEEQERKRYESGKKALELYFRTFYSDQQNPILLEGRFKVAVGPVLLNGAVDRVDEIDGGLEIIDYKTGKAPAKGEKGDDDVQLKLYALAVGDMFKKPVKSAKFLYVEAGIAKDVDITAEVKERVIDDVTEKWARIQDMLFLPQPGPLCKFCDYRGICDYAQV